MLEWHDRTGRNGLQVVLAFVARLLSPEENEASGLLIGDLIIHLIRNGGDAVLPVLPDMLRAMVIRLTSADTATFIQVCSRHYSRPALLPPMIDNNVACRVLLFRSRTSSIHNETLCYHFSNLSTISQDHRQTALKFSSAHGSTMQRCSLGSGQRASGASVNRFPMFSPFFTFCTIQFPCSVSDVPFNRRKPSNARG